MELPVERAQLDEVLDELGLADVASLARVIAEREAWRTLGDEILLRRHVRERAGATRAMGWVTDSLLQGLAAVRHGDAQAMLAAPTGRDLQPLQAELASLWEHNARVVARARAAGVAQLVLPAPVPLEPPLFAEQQELQARLMVPRAVGSHLLLYQLTGVTA